MKAPFILTFDTVSCVPTKTIKINWRKTQNNKKDFGTLRLRPGAWGGPEICGRGRWLANWWPGGRVSGMGAGRVERVWAEEVTDEE